MPLKPKIKKRPTGIVRAQKLAGKFMKAVNPPAAKAVKSRKKKEK
jgi:hypothetical protein